MNTEIITLDAHDDEIQAAITAAQRTILTQETPKEVIKERKGPSGIKLSYVEHSWVTATLNQAFGWRWSWEIIDYKLLPHELEATEVFVLGKLTVHTPVDELVKTQFGGQKIKRYKSGEPMSIADDLKAASSDALKKAASLLGIALDLYGSDLSNVYDDQPEQTQSKTVVPFRSPEAAIAWSIDQGAFTNKQHAKNAYNKLKDDKQPTTAEEMAELWRADVRRRIDEQ